MSLLITQGCRMKRLGYWILSCRASHLAFSAEKQGKLKAANLADSVDLRIVRQVKEERFFKKFST
jgi:hypothetical protein